MRTWRRCSRLLLPLAMTSPSANALAPFSVTVGMLQTPELNLQNLQISLKNTASGPQFKLSAKPLALPQPFRKLRQLNIHCRASRQASGLVACQNGRMRLDLQDLPTLSAAFELSMDRRKQWDIELNAAEISGQYLTLLPLPEWLPDQTSRLRINLHASGKRAALHSLQVSGQTDHLTGQSQDGRYAVENLAIQTSLQARISDQAWHWRNQIRIDNGALYAEPVYLEAAAGLNLDSAGSWSPQRNRWTVTSINYQDGRAARLNGAVVLEAGEPKVRVKSAALAFHSEDLQRFSQSYLNPFLEQSVWEGFALNGQLSARLTIADNRLKKTNIALTDIAVKDSKARLGITGGNGIINWSAAPGLQPSSYLAWQKLTLGPLPIGASQLTFSAQDNDFKLLKQASLSVLGGRMVIKQLAWQGRPGRSPDIRFSGRLTDLSLPQLSQVLGWPSLSGAVSGAVPEVGYSDGLLKLDGGLTVKAFDGAIKLNNLAVSGLFSDFSKLHADLSIDRLDLQQLTQKFRFGTITGRLSGFIRRIHLENWHPINFFAWLGTPEHDRSRRRISQQAVKNIASISGNSATDIVTQGLLSIFENFSYDKIGLGCYLNNGVCQLMGIGPASGGYSIVAGGGLPRIDVIGYNPKIDWAVFINRLRRITATDEAIVK